MTFRKIYYGTSPISRVYLNGKLVWDEPIPVYAGGDVYIYSDFLANGLSATASLSQGVLTICLDSTVSPYAEEICALLMHFNSGSQGSASGSLADVVLAQGETNIHVECSASGHTYSIVWSRGEVYTDFDISGSVTTASVTLTGAVSQGNMLGCADGSVDNILWAHGTLYGSTFGTASALTQQPDDISASCSGECLGACGGYTIRSDSVILDITTDAENAAVVFVLVDDNNHALENVSDPESQGEDYIIQIY